MPEYFLRILGSEIITKRMVAEDHDVAIRAAIKWEGHNPDMDLTCGLQRIAARRKSVWLLRPDAGCEDDDEFAREAMDDFTTAADWASSGIGMRRGIGVSAKEKAQDPKSKDSESRQSKLSTWLRGRA